MLNVLISADWHCSFEMMPQCERAMVNLRVLCAKGKLDTVVFAGDLKSSYNPVDIRVTRFWLDAIESLRKNGIWVVIILGNHDRIGLHGTQDQNWLPVLARAGADVYWEPSRIRDKEGRTIVLIPFCANAEQWDRAKDYVDNDGFSPKTDILVFHQNITGAKFSKNSPMVSESGFHLSDLKPEKFLVCIGGDIHLPQKIGENAWYVGSPFSQDFGECNQTKYFCVIKDGKVRFVPTEMPGWYDPQVKGFRPPKDWKGSRIRISVPVSKGDMYGDILANARIDAEKEYAGADVVIVPVFEEVGFRDDDVPDSDLSDVEHIGNYCKRYLKETIPQKYMVKFILDKLAETGKGIRTRTGIRFLKAVGEKFLCFPKIEMDYDKRGLVVISGVNRDWPGRSNGTAKTSLMDLLPAAIFGRTFKDQAGDEWAQRGTKGTVEVLLEMKSSDGKRILIERKRRPASVRLWIDGKEASSGSRSADVNRQIEMICGFSWDTFSNSIYFSKEEGSFLLAPPKQRQETLSRLQNMERFAAALDMVRKDIRNRKDTICGLESDISVTDARLEELKKAESLLVDHGEKSELNGLESELSFSDANRKRHEGLFLEMKKAVSATQNDQNKLDAAYWKVKGETDANAKETEKWSSLAKGSGCPYCGGRLDHATVSEKLRWLNAERISLQMKMNVLSASRKAGLVKLDEWRKKASESENAGNILMERIAQLGDRIQSLRDTISRREDARKAHLSGRKELLDERNRISVAMVKEKQRIVFLLAAESILMRDGLPAYLNSILCPQLNRAAAYYSDLFSEGQIRVVFSIEEGEVCVEILNPNGGENLKDQSAGELRMASLIASFSLREVSPKANVLILDEPGDGLDPENARAFASGLRKMKDKFGTILIASHNQHILDELSLEENIVVEKRNGESCIMLSDSSEYRKKIVREHNNLDSGLWIR